MGLTGVYNAAVSEDVATSLVNHAFTKGITFFDTSDVYGPHLNEILLGKVLFYSFKFTYFSLLSSLSLLFYFILDFIYIHLKSLYTGS